MLSALRSAAGTWVAKLLLVLLVVSFAVWGITGSMLTGVIGNNNVVTAGETTVSPVQFRLAYNRQLNVLSQQFGQQLTAEQASALGLENQVLSQLAAGAVLDEQARRMGLGVSEDALANLIFEDAAFQGPSGQFDRQRFDYVLRQIGMSQRDYLDGREQDAARQHVVEAVSDGLAPTDAFLRAVSLYRGEDRTVEYVRLPETLVQPVEEPAADALTKWFDERKADYAAPEYRKLAYVTLDVAAIADEAAIAEEDVRRAYDANKARYTKAETRTVEQLVFTEAARAEAAATALKGGSTWDQIVAGEGKTAQDIALGSVTREGIPDKAIADAAFALPLNEVSGVVQGTFGPVLLSVTAITPETVEPYEAVSAALRSELAQSEASSALIGIRDSFEDARASGATLREAADRLKLKVATVDAIDRNALRPDGTVINDLPASQDLIRGAFETEPGTDNLPITIQSGGFVFYDVEGVTPARDRTLDEVRERVVSDWKTAEAQARLGTRAAELEKQVKDGTKTLDAVATELSLAKETKLGLKRQANDADFGPEGVEAVFSLPEGGVGLVPASDAQILFKVTQSTAPMDAGPEAVAAEVRDQYASGLSNDLLDQIIVRLQAQYEVTVNRDAASRALNF